MRIDDRVREAHLTHYCPGGMGVPVSSSGTVGLPSGQPDSAPAGDAADANRLQAPGETCERCGQLLLAGQDVRRRPTGELVHGTCPPPLPACLCAAAGSQASPPE
jgi:hypothetical protein